jgi:hypothetical protein
LLLPIYFEFKTFSLIFVACVVMSAQFIKPEVSGTIWDVDDEAEAEAQEVNESKKEVIELGGVHGLYATVYSAKSLAVFGETKPCKELLKVLGGQFNKSLEEPKAGGRACGWVFRIKGKDAVISALKEYAKTGSFAPPLPQVAAAAAASVSDESKILKSFPTLGVHVVEYTKWSVAVLGETKPLKNQLSALNGKYNPSLRGGAGWVFPKRCQSEVLSSLSEISSEKEGGGEKPAKKKQELMIVQWPGDVVDCECAEPSCEICSR